MSNYKILVIDDEEYRNASYERLLKKDFEIEILNDISIGKISAFANDPLIDCILLDMVLSTGTHPGEIDQDLFELVVDTIGKKKPVILTSRYFNTAASWVTNAREDRADIIYFFSWDEIFNTRNEFISASIANYFVLRIQQLLNKFFDRTHSKKEPDRSIVILHLSDIQFGDGDTVNDIKVLSEKIIADGIMRDLKLEVDFIALTGDITYQGLPSEFEQATDWINALCKNLFPGVLNYSERILLIPGNHDVNISLTAADYLDFNFSSKISKAEDITTELMKPRVKPVSDHLPIGLWPFARFAHEVTADSQWLDSSTGLCFVNDRFLNWGIRFVHLNSVMELNCLQPKAASFKSRAITMLGRKTARLPDDYFTVYLVHNGPDDMDYIHSGDQPESVTALFGLINAIGGDLYLHGHRHSNERQYKKNYEGNSTTHIQYAQAGTISLNKKALPSGTRRGFAIFELKRSEGKITGWDRRLFEFDQQRIDEVRLKKETFIKYRRGSI